MNEKQQQLTFDKGITNVPSDAICSDNSLQEEEGLIYRDGEHRVIQSPVDTGLRFDGTLLYVHAIGNTKRYIVLGEDNYINSVVEAGSSGQGQDDLLLVGTNVSVTSMGKVLIVNDSNGLHYLVFEDGEYHQYPTEMPTPDIECKMVFSGIKESEATNMANTGLSFNTRLDITGIADEQVWKNVLVGMYSANKTALAREGHFWSCFWIVAALRLKDETYVKMTAPILMVPNVDTNSSLTTKYDDNQTPVAILKTWHFNLSIRLKTDYKAYEEFVDKVVLFVSEQVENINNDVVLTPLVIPNDSILPSYGYFNGISVDNGSMVSHRTPLRSRDNAYAVQSQRYSGLDDRLKDKNIFYKLKEIDIDEHTWVGCSESRENLEQHERLTSTYLTTYNNIPAATFVYNSRLFIANIIRKPICDFYNFRPKDDTETHKYSFFVRIKVDDRRIVYRYDVRTNQPQGAYFFYPDNRAEHVIIFKDDNIKILDVDLEQHETLNGVFYLGSNLTGEPTGTEASSEGIETDVSEYLPGQVMTTEVNNPFVFPAKGYFSVDGTILAMTTITNAISQGQFGQYPVIVFASKGISACYIGSEGWVTSTSPLSREVCSDPNSVTQTDKAIFFVSQKGLMRISESGVEHVSEQLIDGMPTNGLIAYDYRDSLLWIINGMEALIYSLLSGTFSSYSLLQIQLPFDGIIDLDPLENPPYQDEQGLWHGWLNYNDGAIVNGGPVEHVTGTYTTYYNSHTKAFCRLWRVWPLPDYTGGSIPLGEYYLDGLWADEGTRYYYQGSSSTETYYNRENGKLYEWQYNQGAAELIEAPQRNSVVNDYPDSLIQYGRNVFSLMQRPRISDDTNVYDCHILSRPLKLENGTALKSILQTRHILDLSEGSSFQFVIEASNNMKDWCQLTSLHGKPWKYYRFRYQFGNLKASDTFAGSIVVTQERRTNKLR